MKNLKTLFETRKKTVYIVAGVLVLLAIILLVRGGGEPQSQLIKAVKGNVVQEVSATGKVESAKELSLSFEKSGRVVQVNREVGSRVAAGQVIAVLGGSELAAQLASAEAAVSAAEAKLDELKRGARPEELAIKQTALDQAKLSLSTTYTGIFTTLESAYILSDDAVRQKTDALFSNDEQPNPNLTFSTYDIQAQIDAERGRLAIGQELTAWRGELSSLSSASSAEELEKEISSTEKHLAAVQDFLRRAQDALVQQVNLSSATLSTYQTSLTAARTAVSNSIAAVTSAKQGLAAQKLAVTRAENDLSLAKAGSSAETIRIQEAQVASARANADQVRAEIGKTVIRSPISGIVTKQEAKVGQIVSPNVPMVAVMSDSKFEISANIPETDIGRVKVGQPVQITLDAFPGDKFEGSVAAVDPAETVIDGAIDFKIKVVFDRADPRIKSGFTANLDIRTLTKENVITLPQHAIIRNDDGIFVKKMVEDKEVQVPVETGIQGRDGSVEIISGVGENEEVLNVGAKAAS